MTTSTAASTTHRTPRWSPSPPGPQDFLTGTGLCGTGTPLAGQNGRCGYGPRLPFIVISPWAKHDYVDHNLTRLQLDRSVHRGQLGTAEDPGLVRRHRWIDELLVQLPARRKWPLDPVPRPDDRSAVRRRRRGLGIHVPAAQIEAALSPQRAPRHANGAVLARGDTLGRVTSARRSATIRRIPATARCGLARWPASTTIRRLARWPASTTIRRLARWPGPRRSAAGHWVGSGLAVRPRRTSV